MLSEEEIRTLLFDYVDDLLDEQIRAQISAGIEASEDLKAAYLAIVDTQSQVNVWHLESVPPWTRPSVMRTERPGFLLWFPTLASSLALVLVTIILLRPAPQSPLTEQSFPPPGLSTATPATYLSEPDRSALVQALLESSRDQRQREMQSLVTLLKAEMDRRALETEQSLRYVITHQIQGQQEIDDLYQRVRLINYSGAPRR